MHWNHFLVAYALTNVFSGYDIQAMENLEFSYLFAILNPLFCNVEEQLSLCLIFVRSTVQLEVKAVGRYKELFSH